MNALGIIGLLLGIVILIVVSYKGFSAVPTPQCWRGRSL